MFLRCLLVVSIAAALATAQRNPRTGAAANPRTNDPFGNTNRGTNNPRQNQQQRGPAAKSRFDDLAARLQLDKDQKKAVRQLFDQVSKEAEPLRQQIQKANHELVEAAKAEKPQAELDQLVQKQAPLQARMAELELKAFARMFKELDPNQYKKAEEMIPRLAGFFPMKKWNSLD